MMPASSRASDAGAVGGVGLRIEGRRLDRRPRRHPQRVHSRALVEDLGDVSAALEHGHPQRAVLDAGGASAAKRRVRARRSITHGTRGSAPDSRIRDGDRDSGRWRASPSLPRGPALGIESVRASELRQAACRSRRYASGASADLPTCAGSLSWNAGPAAVIELAVAGVGRGGCLQSAASSTGIQMLERSQVQEAIDAGGGLLRLEPCWVPRSFMIPGRRLKLHPDDLYASAGIAAASTSGGSRRRPTPTTARARRPTKG